MCVVRANVVSRECASVRTRVSQSEVSVRAHARVCECVRARALRYPTSNVVQQTVADYAFKTSALCSFQRLNSLHHKSIQSDNDDQLFLPSSHQKAYISVVSVQSPTSCYREIIPTVKSAAKSRVTISLLALAFS